jgi:hypothetical protein
MGSEEKPPLSKEIIMGHARKGAFDNSPLICTVHVVTCPNCRCKKSLLLLEYLKIGAFEIGKVEQIEVLNTEGAITFVEKEMFTPIIVRPVCHVCISQYEVRLVSSEYLKQIVDRPEASKSMYA